MTLGQPLEAIVPSRHPTTTPRTTVMGLLRVSEWTKNLLVLAPLVFSGRLLDTDAIGRILIVGAALCALSSSIYIVNDLRDLARDRAHPTKRFRPLAAGIVPPFMGILVAGGLVVLSYAITYADARIPRSVLGYMTAFLVLNLAYSLYLKRKVIADVLAIASGYVLRVFIGGAAIGVWVSHWLVLCTFLLATFLGFSKRRHELTLLGAHATSHRLVLSLYSREFLDQASLLTLAMTLTCYMLYTIAPETVERFHTYALVYSSVIVMFALLRYLFLIHVKHLGSPVEVLYSDRQIVLAIVVWVVYVTGVIYTWPILRGSTR